MEITCGSIFMTFFKYQTKAIIIVLLSLLNGCACEPSSLSEALIQVYSPHSSYEVRGSKRVLVGGCFDVLHVGHFELLKKAKEQGDYLIVALESDERIVVNKQRKLIHTQMMRAANLAAVRYVNEIILLPSLKTYDDYQLVVQKIYPDIIAVTQNDPYILNKIKQAQSIGAKVKVVNSIIPGCSSSIIRSKY